MRKIESWDLKPEDIDSLGITPSGS
jgi:hypothetical protein